MKIFEKIFGDPNEKELSKLRPLVDEINHLEKLYRKKSNDELAGMTDHFRKQINDGKSLDDILTNAFATVREASRRVLKMRHFDVQLLGGIVLHQGKISEMKTGEGKTLVATLPLYLNALSGKGVHLVTVNDYLAKRDAVWMGHLYNFLGLSVGSIQHDSAFLYDHEYKPSNDKPQETDEEKKENEETADGTVKGLVKVEMDYLRPVERKEAYMADITYGTNNEFGFDYLRDNMVPSLDRMVQRELNFAIVDEVDSILIDEARTPLIISAPDSEPTDKYYQFTKLVEQLEEGPDYNVDEKMRAVSLTDEGISKIEKWLGVDNIYVERGIRDVHHIEQALRAHALFKKDKDYVVKDGEVIIVDEFTGRLMYGRRYSDGLHQAIEAKEKVQIQKESITMATITFQNLFRMYNKLSGMTGTALTEAEEFYKIYGLDTIVIPTNRPVIRKDNTDRIYKSEKGKIKAIVKEVRSRQKKGQPVLVGTISVDKNERLGREFEAAGIRYEILNAKNHEREAEIIAKAGAPGSVTLATNMAGRGVDIVLGGSSADDDEQQKVKELGGLYVVGTERHESRRIDNQLRGRSGRQGDPGESQFFVSMEDDLMRIFGSDRMKTMMERLGVPDDVPIEHKLISKSIEQAQKKVEGHNFDTRKHLVEYDDVINKHREVIYKKRREILEKADNFLEAESDSIPQKDERAADLQRKNDNKLEVILFDYIINEIQQLVSFHTSDEDESKWNLDEIYETVDSIFPIPLDVRLKIEDIRETSSDLEYGKGVKEKHSAGNRAQTRDKIINYIIDLARRKFDELSQIIGDKNAMRDILKSVLIRSIDTLWVEHIDAMDHLRTGIGLRGYGQRDPLVEYKKEAFTMFQSLQNNIQKQVVYSIFKVSHGVDLAGVRDRIGEEKSQVYKTRQQLHGAAKTGDEASSAFSSSDPAKAGATSLSLPMGVHLADEKRNRDSDGRKIGRNDPCWCGSGKKFKKCHGV